MPYYQCPRCDSQNIYWAKRSKPQWLGDLSEDGYVRSGREGKTVWKEVDTPLCKDCGEECNSYFYEDELAKHLRKKKIEKVLIAGVALFVLYIFVSSIIEASL
jgi:hypothetical protein